MAQWGDFDVAKPGELAALRARIARLEAALAPLVALAGVIRKDAEKATKGPWRDGGLDHVSSDGGDVALIGRWTDSACEAEASANCRLICALRNAVPAILAAADAAGGEG